MNRVASASVWGPDAETADAIATMLSVVEPIEGLGFVAKLLQQDSFPPKSLGCLIIDPNGQRFRNEALSVSTPLRSNATDDRILSLR